MSDIYYQLALGAVLAGLTSIKNPQRKAKFRNIVLRVYEAIKVIYADDPGFN